MKCYTLNEKEITPGVSLEGLPVDGSFGKEATAENVKLVILLKERDGISPSELLDEDPGRMAACGKIVLTKSAKDSKNRFLVLYDPRQWFLDPSSGKDGFIAYRSRGRFMAVARGRGFLMKNSDGSLRVSAGKSGPAVQTTGKTPLKIPGPDEGWILATME